MRLINSDSEVTYARDGGAIVKIDAGFISVGVMLVAVAISIWALADGKATRDLADARDDAWHLAFENALVRIRDAETAAKLNERRYMDMVAYAELNGWKVDGDIEHGPTGNTKRMIGDKHGRK